MKQILSVQEAIRTSNKLKNQGERIVLVGGCFDILHVGHVVFLESAKKKGDILFVFVESDQKVKLIKGKDRPIHTQQERAKVLAALRFVDYVILLPFFKKDSAYDELVKKLKPAIIAATKNDPEIYHKKRSAKLSGAKVVYATSYITNVSTSRIITQLSQE